jgi:hypothetical protein
VWLMPVPMSILRLAANRQFTPVCGMRLDPALIAEVNRSAEFLDCALRQYLLVGQIYQSLTMIGTCLIVHSARFRTAGV